jgi:hypothetical protein
MKTDRGLKGLLPPFLRTFLAFVVCVTALRLAAGADSPRGAQRWAILIGVDQYINVRHLKFCGADQVDLGRQLIASGFDNSQVFILHDKAQQKRYLPFKTNIEDQLTQVLDMVQNGDTLVIGFSGHGISKDGKSYLLPEDAKPDDPTGTMIPVDDIYAKISACKAGLKLMIVDACRNDPFVEGTKRGNFLNMQNSSRGLVAALESPPQGISLLQSCDRDQFACEDENLRHGVFINFIIDGLKGNAADNDGVISLYDLVKYATRKTQVYVHDKFNSSQTPVFKGELSGTVELCRISRRKLDPDPVPVPKPNPIHVIMPDPIPAPPTPKGPGQILLETNLTDDEVAKTESGLQYEVIKPAKPGALPVYKDGPYYVMYKVMRTDGTKDRDGHWKLSEIFVPPGPVCLDGQDKDFIAGWIEAMQLMHEGDHWQVYVPPDLAYGERGFSAKGANVRPNEVIIFDIQLLHISRMIPVKTGGQIPFKDSKAK